MFRDSPVVHIGVRRQSARLRGPVIMGYIDGGFAARQATAFEATSTCVASSRSDVCSAPDPSGIWGLTPLVAGAFTVMMRIMTSAGATGRTPEHLRYRSDRETSAMV